jgi:hypothetical protein
MNPLALIALALSGLFGVTLAVTSDPQTDTIGLVSESTVYTAPLSGTVGLDTASDASGSPKSVVTTMPQYTGPGCREWAETALRAGFVLDDLWLALQVAELESACLPNAIGDNGQSFGLMQIHTPSWCQPTKYWPRGYLQTKGMIDDCTELFDPLTNLWVAWHIATNYGWQNWSTYDNVLG